MQLILRARKHRIHLVLISVTSGFPGVLPISRSPWMNFVFDFSVGVNSPCASGEAQGKLPLQVDLVFRQPEKGIEGIIGYMKWDVNVAFITGYFISVYI